jgi:hypothetical protein
MKKLFAAVVLALTVCSAFAQYYIAADFNGWNTTGNLMTDMGGGIWKLDLSAVGGRHEFKVTLGDWANSWPGSGNSWFFGDASGNMTITFNANDLQDGWRGNWGRLSTSTDPGTWTAVGDWNNWNNAGNSMVSLGGGVYQYQQQLSPGWYQWKAVVSGSWDAIGDDFRGVNANTTWFEVTAENPIAVFEVNAFSGTERVYLAAVPEPATLSLATCALALFLRLRLGVKG